MCGDSLSLGNYFGETVTSKKDVLVCSASAQLWIIEGVLSAKLQILDEMFENGHCIVEAAGGAIVCSIDSDKIKHDIYKTELL
jgi:threonine dehydratase